MKNLQKELEKYYNENYLPMHMPGHKRNLDLLGVKLPYNIVITEITGFDDLHHAEGIIKNIEEKAKKIYGSKRSFILVNGSTCGILSGIRSVTKFGDKVLVSRNSHKSVYNAIEINGLEPVYVLPEIGEDKIDRNISARKIEEKIKENKDIKLIIITSPTYEGVISNIKEIVEIAHKYNIPVLVDEAHGAHLKFMNIENEALNSGADIVIQSLHKTLPALTGTAILHMQGELVKEENIKRELSIFETSSPSYVLMSSIDNCLDLLEKKGKELFKQYEENLKIFYKETKNLEKLKILGNEIKEKNYYDFGKIVIKTDNTNITGKELFDILRKKYKIELEMTSINYVIAMTSICDTKENFTKLLNALKEIDRDLEKNEQKEQVEINIKLPKINTKILDAVNNENSEYINYKNAKNMVSKEYIWVYPPGIPLITPGEIIDEKIIKKVEEFNKNKIEVRTTYDKFPNINVIKI